MIKADGLSVFIEGKTIIGSVCFDVRDGEYLSVIGPNGAGKSTLLKSLCRIIKTVSGKVEVLGKDLAGYDQKELAKKITYIAQLPANDFTVEEFILLSRYPYFSPFSGITAEDREKTRESMKITYTGDFAKRKLSDLSSGERQRVAIASALAQETEIILFDEPVTHLDPYFDHQISELIFEIGQKRNITVVNATHNLNNALKYSDRIMALKKGSLEFIKSPDDISAADMSLLFGIGFTETQNPSDKKKVMIRL
jgi:iron complex transport system ATP-binding protein